MVGQVAMAKKKIKPERAPRDTINNFRSTREWRAWFDRLTDHCRLAPADVIDHAIVDYAKKVGFPEAPPKR